MSEFSGRLMLRRTKRMSKNEIKLWIVDLDLSPTMFEMHQYLCNAAKGSQWRGRLTSGRRGPPCAEWAGWRCCRTADICGADSHPAGPRPHRLWLALVSDKAVTHHLYQLWVHLLVKQALRTSSSGGQVFRLVGPQWVQKFDRRGGAFWWLTSYKIYHRLH